MIVAELEIYHSRPIAPTRRVGLGYADIPVGPGPGLGGVLLAGIMATAVPAIDAEDREALYGVCDAIGAFGRVNQPAARHRYQDDLVGLAISRQFLRNIDGVFEFDFETEIASPTQLALGALYAVEKVPAEKRKPVLEAIRFAMVWEDLVETRFISEVLSEARLSSTQVDRLGSWSDPVSWAMGKLGLSESIDELSRKTVQKVFRDLIREAHPDHGGVEQDASERVKDLTDARDILISKV